MNFLRNLFKSKNPAAVGSGTVRSASTIPGAKVDAPAAFAPKPSIPSGNEARAEIMKAGAALMAEALEKNLRVDAELFTKTAATGSAWSRLSIKNIPAVIAGLNLEMEQLKIPSENLHDLYNNTLLGVCPRCNEYCAGKALLRMPLLAAADGGVMFTGNSGGFERMLQGTCLNYSCSSTEFDLFWAPDLNPQMLQNLRGRGINLDPDIQRTRNHVWEPSQPTDTNSITPDRSSTPEFNPSILGLLEVFAANQQPHHILQWLKQSGDARALLKSTRTQVLP